MTRPAAQLGCLALVLGACLGAKCRTEPVIAPDTGPRPLLVDTFIVQPRRVRDVVRATGVVEAARTTVVSAEVAGTVATFDIQIGQSLGKGDLVAAIDDESYRIDQARATALRDAAKAALGQATQDHARETARVANKTLFEEKLRTARFLEAIALADRNQATSLHRDTKRRLERQQALFRKGVASQGDLDDARDAEESARARLEASQKRLDQAQEHQRRQDAVFASPLLSREALDQAAAQLAAARAKLASAQADLDAAAKTLRDCRIAAPFAARIAEKHVELGQRVAPGTPIATLVDVSRVKLAVGLPDVDFVRIRVGTPATIAVDARPGPKRTEAVARVAPTASTDTGTFVAEIDVANNGGKQPLLPGMIARVELTIATYPHAIVVPHDAVLDDEGARSVFVIARERATPKDKGKKKPPPEGVTARRREVTVARILSNGALIAAGLRAGDEVVVLGQRSLRDGAAVRVRVTAGASAAGPDTPTPPQDSEEGTP